MASDDDYSPDDNGPDEAAAAPPPTSPAHWQQDQPVQAAPPSHGGCGKCCLFGCLGVAIFAVVAAIGLYLALPYLGRQFRDAYTASEPKELPKLKVTEEEIGEINRRIDGFKKVAEGQTIGTVLTLSARDVNALIAGSDAWKDKPGRVFVRIEDDKIMADVSLPLDDMVTDRDGRETLDKLGLTGRYFNASATLKMELRGGKLVVHLDDATVKGKAVPGVLMAAIRKQNLAEDLSVKNPQMAKDLRKLDSIEVKDGQIIIKSKTANDKAAAEPDDDPDVD